MMALIDGSNVKARTLQALRRDPRKAGALAILALLLAVMLFRTIRGNRPQPASAAAPVASLRSAKSRPAGPAPTLRPTTGNPALQKWAETPPAPISRNLFAVRMEYFPVEGTGQGLGSASGGEGFWMRLEKSLALQADQKDKRENQIANYRAKAAELRLQSTMMGPQPKAMVNGELVGEGDVVASFRVLRIEARRMIVEREGIRLEIQMK